MERFDDLLILTCSVLSNDSPSLDDYGQKSASFASWVVVASSVACRISTDAFGRPHEFKDEKESSLNYRRIFMRSPTLSNSQTLNPHHVILLNSIYYNIFEVLPIYDRSSLHHLEVIVEDVKP